jgi:hypothetical protein
MAECAVECYSGRHYPERPRALWWEAARLEVEETERHWRSQGVAYSDPILYHYMVRTAHGHFHLIYDTDQEKWSATRSER